MINEMLAKDLNHIAAYLSYGVSWHTKVANELRRMPKLRGYARWHDDGEAAEDAMCRIKLDKLLGDQLGYAPKPDMAWVATASAASIKDLDGFKAHFAEWTEREGKFLATITSAIDKMRTEDISVYNELCNLSTFVKNEKIRAEWVYNGLVFVGWEPHHIAVESKWLHDYFEKVWKPGDPIDFNIG
ncbi:MAG: hypothetical protein FWG72_01980 [Oscillospiraceae bacterium]|nr:hypothetical protein [Oscillospiraceae bacterium]